MAKASAFLVLGAIALLLMLAISQPGKTSNDDFPQHLPIIHSAEGTPTPTISPSRTPGPPPPAGCNTCSYNAYNCDDFQTQQDAQDCFEYCLDETGRDIHDLDRDNDGVACEDRP